MRSAKTTVTTLRATASAGFWTGPEDSEVPQLMQNFAMGPHTAPPDGHRRSRRAPHSSQNAAGAGLSCWHCEQVMGWPPDLQIGIWYASWYHHCHDNYHRCVGAPRGAEGDP